MGNDKFSLPKPTASINAQATPIVKPAESSKACTTPSTTVTASGTEKGAIKNDSDAIKSATPADSIDDAKKTVISPEDKAASASEKDSAVRTKMGIATDIYQRMKKNKNITRKEILEQFISEAKLSKAGASTYFQLIKAKLK